MSLAGNPPPAKKGLVREYAPTVVAVLSVWLGWQVVRELVTERAPPAQAIQIAPDSASVLSRAAEVALQTEDHDTAALLAEEALARAPFSSRSLRVLGLATAEKGNEVLADEMLTLAGNWSLRDDPTHAWLMQYRLRRGDYRSAFAHADTLARRRPDLRPRLFEFFDLAARSDPRAMGALLQLLSANPPWRRDFLDDLNTSSEGLTLGATLAIGAANTRAAFTPAELAALHSGLLSKGQIGAMAEVRRRTTRPGGPLLVDGDFDAPTHQPPYDWMLHTAAGVIVETRVDEVRGGTALRVQHGSFDAQQLAFQLLHLKPGRYRFSGEGRVESGAADSRLAWTISCLETEQLLTPQIATAGSEWKPFTAEFSVPRERCAAQWIRLKPLPSDGRATVAAWFDRFTITPAAGPAAEGDSAG